MTAISRPAGEIRTAVTAAHAAQAALTVSQMFRQGADRRRLDQADTNANDDAENEVHAAGNELEEISAAVWRRRRRRRRQQQYGVAEAESEEAELVACVGVAAGVGVAKPAAVDEEEKEEKEEKEEEEEEDDDDDDDEASVAVLATEDLSGDELAVLSGEVLERVGPWVRAGDVALWSAAQLQAQVVCGVDSLPAVAAAVTALGTAAVRSPRGPPLHSAYAYRLPPPSQRVSFGDSTIVDIEGAVDGGTVRGSGSVLSAALRRGPQTGLCAVVHCWHSGGSGAPSPPRPRKGLLDHYRELSEKLLAPMRSSAGSHAVDGNWHPLQPELDRATASAAASTAAAAAAAATAAAAEAARRRRQREEAREAAAVAAEERAARRHAEQEAWLEGLAVHERMQAEIKSGSSRRGLKAPKQPAQALHVGSASASVARKRQWQVLEEEEQEEADEDELHNASTARGLASSGPSASSALSGAGGGFALGARAASLVALQQRYRAMAGADVETTAKRSWRIGRRPSPRQRSATFGVENIQSSAVVTSPVEVAGGGTSAAEVRDLWGLGATAYARTEAVSLVPPPTAHTLDAVAPRASMAPPLPLSTEVTANAPTVRLPSIPKKRKAQPSSEQGSKRKAQLPPSASSPDASSASGRGMVDLEARLKTHMRQAQVKQRSTHTESNAAAAAGVTNIGEPPAAASSVSTSAERVVDSPAGAFGDDSGGSGGSGCMRRGSDSGRLSSEGKRLNGDGSSFGHSRRNKIRCKNQSRSTIAVGQRDRVEACPGIVERNGRHGPAPERQRNEAKAGRGEQRRRTERHRTDGSGGRERQEAIVAVAAKERSDNVADAAAAEKPLPAGWVVKFSKRHAGRRYYVNRQTKETLWRRPLDKAYADAAASVPPCRESSLAPATPVERLAQGETSRIVTSNLRAKGSAEGKPSTVPVRRVPPEVRRARVAIFSAASGLRVHASASDCGSGEGEGELWLSLDGGATVQGQGALAQCKAAIVRRLETVGRQPVTVQLRGGGCISDVWMGSVRSWRGTEVVEAVLRAASSLRLELRLMLEGEEAGCTAVGGVGRVIVRVEFEALTFVGTLKASDDAAAPSLAARAELVHGAIRAAVAVLNRQRSAAAPSNQISCGKAGQAAAAAAILWWRSALKVDSGLKS
eukprot:SAG11_NODE_515_length_8826_cov_11.352469_2_plen_1153_part_00